MFISLKHDTVPRLNNLYTPQNLCTVANLHDQLRVGPAVIELTPSRVTARCSTEPTGTRWLSMFTIACCTVLLCFNYSTVFSRDNFSSFENSTTEVRLPRNDIYTKFKIKMSQLIV